MFCYFVGVLCIFFLTENHYVQSQTNRKRKSYPRIKNCIRRTAKSRSKEQQTSLLIATEFSLWPANFLSNRNVALHARSLGPPWDRLSLPSRHLKALVFLYAFEESVHCHLLSSFCHDSNLHISLYKYVLSTMGVSKESISKFFLNFADAESTCHCWMLQDEIFALDRWFCSACILWAGSLTCTVSVLSCVPQTGNENYR